MVVIITWLVLWAILYKLSSRKRNQISGLEDLEDYNRSPTAWRLKGWLARVICSGILSFFGGALLAGFF